MNLQIIKDGHGVNTGIFIPISDWNVIIQKHEDLKQLLPAESVSKTKLSDLAGKLSAETADEMLKYIENGRKEWDDRLRKQFE